MRGERRTFKKLQRKGQDSSYRSIGKAERRTGKKIVTPQVHRVLPRFPTGSVNGQLQSTAIKALEVHKCADCYHSRPIVGQQQVFYGRDPYLAST